MIETSAAPVLVGLRIDPLLAVVLFTGVIVRAEVRANERQTDRLADYDLIIS